jgi:outer membrane protein OmpA-like peptidoglycan-associated protein
MKRHFLTLSLVATLIVPAFGQQQDTSATSTQQTQSTPAQSTPDQSATPATTSGTDANTQYATGKPLAGQQKEGFWGHLQPFARKKYVQRQLNPVRDRVNELDQLTSKNAASIRDVDTRAQKGIQEANSAAQQADQHAQAANQLATQANQTATSASSQLQTVQTAVGKYDQYQPVTDAEIRFRPGQTKLSDQAKQALDQIADQLKGHNGYILQVQGFSTTKGQAGITNSQAITQSVVRYLVEQHDVPLFRIYTLGLGNAQVKATNAQAADQQGAQETAATTRSSRPFRGGRVEVALLKNGLADLGTQSAQNAAPQTPGAGTPNTNAMPQSDQNPR